jgi:hypothetical protein
MAIIPPRLLDVVVAIGAPNGDATSWIGTGFLYNRVLGDNNDGSSQVRGYLVTNRHVVEAAETLQVLLNPRDSPQVRIGVPTEFDDGLPVWVAHPDPTVDIAVTGAIHGQLKQLGLVEQLAPLLSSQAYSVDEMEGHGIAEGDTAFVLGFPMGMVEEARARPILRGGVIARIQDAYYEGSREFFVDAQVFPGNSGGPVFLPPPLFGVTDVSPPQAGGLIGVVKQTISYNDVAISPQTGETRVVFSENSGLAVVQTVDCLNEAVNHFEEIYPMDRINGQDAEPPPEP